MDAFATPEELGKRLKRTFTKTETEWVQTLLEDASTYLREDVIGSHVFPEVQSTFTAYPNAGEIEVPSLPLRSVDSVTRDGQSVPFTLRDNVVTVSGDDAVEVTFTHGYPKAPAGLARWAMVLASQAMVPVELELGLTVGGLSSLQLDDFKVAFAAGGEGTGMSLSDSNIRRIRESYGVSLYVGGTR
ncbi:hypothetical protein D9V32_05515 [Mycetocola tolaasinivorans]|uniref:Phage gp6-like head-tail connector protein n=1 Tax=Mycetocola tolaasinivorans TaxID=76635 RepID=A0A3L7A902_9MICO|nr:hypothetical protein [Mycetocola tolaasinivorans]RLP76328.1 hypothetical protein D9V32_05515 [Mycetocola tolaasinivorans]